ncbi:hypothetical protein BS17DRAFT_767618 [Gyrodon lividus]|nr:hypothetical protein BS17DRAFT_767618 [Gyrodon lividus]
MPNINTLSLELSLGPETFCMTFEPQFPGSFTIEIRPTVVKVPIVRPQNIPATIQKGTAFQLNQITFPSTKSINNEQLWSVAKPGKSGNGMHQRTGPPAYTHHINMDMDIDPWFTIDVKVSLFERKPS